MNENISLLTQMRLNFSFILSFNYFVLIQKQLIFEWTKKEKLRINLIFIEHKLKIHLLACIETILLLIV